MAASLSGAAGSATVSLNSPFITRRLASTAPANLSFFGGRRAAALFGFKTAYINGSRVTANYKVKLDTPDGIREFECAGDEFIIDAAEKAGVELPATCRAGSCSTCLGKVLEGEVDRSIDSFLETGQMDKGWVLTCVAYPRSNVTIKTHLEEELFN